MTTTQKIKALENAMFQGTRDNGNKYYYFTENAKEKIKDIYCKLTDNSLNDLDYEIFYKAINTVVEAYNNIGNDNIERLQEYVQDNYNDFASVYTNDRLTYLNIHNESEIVDILKDFSCDSISTACAIWYDRQIQNACSVIIDYLNEI